jgi:signal transduction histidine kinase
VRPHALDSGGLSAALSTLAQIEQDQDGHAEYVVDWKSRATISSATATVVYRIAQEAAVNARKHARASRVRISIADERGGIALRVADDGAGFDPKADLDGGGTYHVGLSAMRERAAIAGGTFHILASPGHGTRVEVWVPIEGLAQAS